MKNILIILLIAIAFSACKKSQDPQPQNPADVVAGTYKLTSFRYKDSSTDVNLPTLPVTKNGTTVSATVQLTPVSATDKSHVNLLLTLKVTGQQDGTINLDMVEVRKTNGAYGLYQNESLISDADGKSLLFNLTETDSQTKATSELHFVAVR